MNRCYTLQGLPHTLLTVPHLGCGNNKALSTQVWWSLSESPLHESSSMKFTKFDFDLVMLYGNILKPPPQSLQIFSTASNPSSQFYRWSINPIINDQLEVVVLEPCWILIRGWTFSYGNNIYTYDHMMAVITTDHIPSQSPHQHPSSQFSRWSINSPLLPIGGCKMDMWFFETLKPHN